MTVDLSIVVPVHNGEATLGAQLEALVASVDDRMEIVVVDNRSTDGTRAIVERISAEHPAVRLVDAAGRTGEAFARNAGVDAAACDLIAFCDADDVVSPTWARAMRDALGGAEYVTGPVELDRLNPPWLSGVRGRRIFAEQPRTGGGIPFAHGCNLGVRRETVRRVGGFDERVRIGADIDFAMRANRSGVRLDWAPDAIVHYRHRASTRERWRQAVAYGRAAQHLHEMAGERWRFRRRAAHQVRRVGWLLATSPRLVDRTHRTRWTWTAALVWGELLGSER